MSPSASGSTISLPGAADVGRVHEIRWQWRKSIERDRRVARGVRAGVIDLDTIAGAQRDRKRIFLVEHVVSVARRARDDGIINRLAIAVGPQPVPDVLILGFRKTAIATDIEVHPASAIGTGPHRYHLAADRAR